MISTQNMPPPPDGFGSARPPLQALMSQPARTGMGARSIGGGNNSDWGSAMRKTNKLNDTPFNLMCPITSEPLVDPVIATTGRTFERATIEAWLERGHVVDPMTGDFLTSTALICNEMIQGAVEHENEGNPSRPRSPPAQSLIERALDQREKILAQQGRLPPTDPRALFNASLAGDLATTLQLIQPPRLHDLNAPFLNGRQTALMAAAQKGHSLIAVALIAAGADPMCADRKGSIALHNAAYRGSVEILDALLCAAPNCLDSANHHGLTAIMVCAMRGMEGAAEFLCSKGADLNRRHQSGRTAAEFAHEAGHAKLARNLRP